MMKNQTTRTTSKRYCKYCGVPVERVSKKSGLYDEKTGEPIIETWQQCMNTECERGCENNGGHQNSWFTGQCKRCGRVPYDYGY